MKTKLLIFSQLSNNCQAKNKALKALILQGFEILTKCHLNLISFIKFEM